MSKSPLTKTWSLAVIMGIGSLALLVGSIWPLTAKAPVQLERVFGVVLVVCTVVTLVCRKKVTDRALLAQLLLGIGVVVACAATDLTSLGTFLTSAGLLWGALWVAAFFSPRLLLLCLGVEFLGALLASTLNQQQLRTLAITMSVLVITAIAAMMLSQLIWDLRRRAEQDQLTGLRNRHGIEQALSELDWRRRSDQPISLALFDLDGLKGVNDRAGHAAGDHVLSEFASELSAAARASDVTARIGGDEFIAILPGATDDDARRWAAELQLHSQVPWSYGIAERVLGEPFDSWLKRADDKLYQAKEQAQEVTRLTPDTRRAHA